MLHVCISVCRFCSPPEAVAIHKAWNLMCFVDIADKTATAGTQHVHGTVIALSMAISTKKRYRIIFKGSPLCPRGLYAIFPLWPSKWSHRVQRPPLCISACAMRKYRNRGTLSFSCAMAREMQPTGAHTDRKITTEMPQFTRFVRYSQRK